MTDSDAMRALNTKAVEATDTIRGALRMLDDLEGGPDTRFSLLRTALATSAAAMAEVCVGLDAAVDGGPRQGVDARDCCARVDRALANVVMDTHGPSAMQHLKHTLSMLYAVLADPNGHAWELDQTYDALRFLVQNSEDHLGRVEAALDIARDFARRGAAAAAA